MVGKKNCFNILFVLQMLTGFGGSEKFLYTLVKKIDREKFCPFVACLKGTKQIIDYFQNEHTKVFVLPLKRIYGPGTIRSAFFLWDVLKRFQIDIVQTFHPLPDLFVPCIAKLYGVPIVISSRRDLGFNKKSYQYFLQRFVNRFVDRFFVNSKAVMRNVIAKENISPSRITVIYNGVDVNGAEITKEKKERLKKELHISSEDYIIGCLANLTPVKGVDFFIDASVQIKKALPNSRFLIVGGGPLEIQLKKKAGELCIRERTIFTGFVTNPERVRELVSIMDISILSSLSEGFSNAILESMALGKPVIATDVGGNAEAIIHEKTGYLVPAKDPEKIATITIKLLSDRSLLHRIGNNALQRAKKYFDINSKVREIERVYLDLMKERFN